MTLVSLFNRVGGGDGGRRGRRGDGENGKDGRLFILALERIIDRQRTFKNDQPVIRLC